MCGEEVMKMLHKARLALPGVKTDFKANIMKILWTFKNMATVGTKKWPRN